MEGFLVAPSPRSAGRVTIAIGDEGGDRRLTVSTKGKSIPLIPLFLIGFPSNPDL